MTLHQEKLAGKTAFVTGGSRGIGRAVARSLADAGAGVFVVARDVDAAARVADELRAEFGVAASQAACDVSDVASIERAFATALNFFGRAPDILINNAGVAESAPLVKTTDEFWQRHLAVNLTGTFLCMRAALPHMVERGWGRVVNVASIAGKTGAPYVSAYSASKHGVIGLTRCAALEVAAKGVTVNAVCPGYVETDMTARAVENITAKTGKTPDEARAVLTSMSPQGRLVQPEEIAALVLLLCSEEGRGINGQAISIDGGTTLV